MAPSLLAVLGFQIAAVLALSTAAARLLKPVLRRMLVKLWGDTVRAEFWETIARLALITAPLLQVVLLAETQPGASLDTILRQSLFHSVSSVFLALAAVGAAIWHMDEPRPPAARGR